MPRLQMLFIFMAATAAAQAGEMHMDELLHPLSPRFMFGSPPRLAGRQAASTCQAGESPCLAINSTGCCPNDNYCYVNPAGLPKCCADDSRCDDPCPISSYQCTVSSTSSCCPRACPAPSAFLCPSSLGGGCCSVGSACLSGNSCSSTINTATVNTVSASPTGCTTGQFSCQPGAGGGCCNIGQTCTAIASQLLCVSGSSTSTNTAGLPTATGPTSPSGGSNGGLSSGAKAGIGVGVTLAALLIFGGLIAWFVVARRRRQRELAAKEQTPADGGAEMSNVSSPGAGSTGPDYFGAQPQPGPYTLNHAASASGMASYGPYSASQRGAVPISPQSPRDITTPVEIAGSGAASPGSAETESGTGLPGPHRGYFDPKPSDVKTAEPSPSDRVELP